MRIADDRLADLVERVRNALWLREIARAAKAGLWVAAGVLAAGTLARWRSGVPTPGMLAALAAVPLALALAVGLGRRPPWAAALAAADRRAGADALLLTACGLPVAPTGTAALVLQQALRALPEWERRVRRDRDRLAVPLLPLGVMLAAAPLLALQPSASPAPPPTPVPMPRPAMASGESLAQVIEQFRSAALAAPSARRDETTDRTLRAAGQQGLPTRASTDASAQPGAAPPGAAPGGEPVPANRPEDSLAGFIGPGLAGTTTGAGGTGRDAAGTGTRGPTGQKAETRTDAAERAIGIARLGRADAVAAGPGSELNAVATEPAETGGNAPPAAAPEPGPTQPGVFGMAQRQLVARYFALRGEKER